MTLNSIASHGAAIMSLANLRCQSERRRRDTIAGSCTRVATPSAALGAAAPAPAHVQRLATLELLATVRDLAPTHGGLDGTTCNGWIFLVPLM